MSDHILRYPSPPDFCSPAPTPAVSIEPTEGAGFVADDEREQDAWRGHVGDDLADAGIGHNGGPPIDVVQGLPLFARINDITARFGLPRTRVYELLASGTLEARKDGKAVLVSVASVLRFIGTLPRADVRLPRTMAKRAAAAASVTSNAQKPDHRRAIGI